MDVTRSALASIALSGLLLATTVAGARTDLDTLVQTEVDFARAAAEKGWRDAFLDFFADDAIVLGADTMLARPRLAAVPSKPPSQVSLVWEPRTGDIAASGDLGWLTGPSTFVDRTAPDRPPAYGNYVTIWKRRADGVWRVLIDVGTATPAPVPFPEGFTRAPMPTRYTGGGATATDASDDLRDSDRQLNEAIAHAGASSAYRAVAAPAMRLHRQGSGTMPAVGAQAIVGWLQEHAAGDDFTTTAAEVSRAGDLGYVYGTYLPSGEAARGGYLRIWARTADGHWLLQLDAVVPPAPVVERRMTGRIPMAPEA